MKKKMITTEKRKVVVNKKEYIYKFLINNLANGNIFILFNFINIL